MTTAARISLALAVCLFLALSAVIFAGTGMTHKRTVQEADFWMAAGCDEVCLHQNQEINFWMAAGCDEVCLHQKGDTPRVKAAKHISDF